MILLLWLNVSKEMHFAHDETRANDGENWGQ